jgi:release factor glutamine methyltransferase
MTIKELRIVGTTQLRRAGVESPALDTDVLIAHALGVSKETLYTHGEKRVPPAKLQRVRRFLGRRVKREPVAYIIGEKEFFGFPLFVGRAVLIPRPETELLISTARDLCPPTGCELIDVGTGSGAIAVVLAKLLPQARVTATDISQEALAFAKRNAKRLGVARRIRFLRGDLLIPSRNAKPLATDRMLIITANLPYLPTAVWKKTQPEIRRYEPRLALDGGPDGMRLVRELLAQLAHLPKPWTLLAEIDPREYRPLRSLAKKLFPSAEVSIIKDFAGKNRVLVISMGAS